MFQITYEYIGGGNKHIIKAVRDTRREIDEIRHNLYRLENDGRIDLRMIIVEEVEYDQIKITHQPRRGNARANV